jgi:hypothetical protein
MKNLLTILFASFTLLAPSISYAAIDVDFETTPLFGVSNFLPGDTVTKTVTVTNTGAVSEDVYTELLNVFDNNLADKVSVKIGSGSTLFSGSFDDYENGNEVFLSTLASGATIVYDFAFSFAPESGNEYQNKSLGFDICVGFSGGQFECDTTDDPNDPDNPGGGGDGGGNNGGGGGGSSSGGTPQVNGDSTGPIPRVAGESTSILPIGAPNTGFGALLSDPKNTVPLAFILFVIIAISGLIVTRRKLQAR